MIGRNGEHPTRFDAIAGNATQPYLPSVAQQTLSTCQGSLASETGTIFPHRSTRANTFQRWHYNDYDDYELVITYTWKTFRTYQAVTKTWQLCPDVFFLPFPRPLSHAHAHTRKNMAGSRDYIHVLYMHTRTHMGHTCIHTHMGYTCILHVYACTVAHVCMCMQLYMCIHVRYMHVQYMHIRLCMYGPCVYVYACTVRVYTCMDVCYMCLRVCVNER